MNPTRIVIDIDAERFEDAYLHAMNKCPEGVRQLNAQIVARIWSVTRAALRLGKDYNETVKDALSPDSNLRISDLQIPEARVRLDKDFAPHSFFWSITYTNCRGEERNGMVGGIIYHRDHSEEEDVGTWSTHT
jgi:hypothetical protein